MSSRHSSATIEQLAETIAALEPQEQENVLVKVAELNYRKGLTALSERIRGRLDADRKPRQMVNEIMEGLKSARDEIASDDYDSAIMKR